MENATKALEMAGSVLLGVLILGCLVFAYSQLANLRRDEETSKIVEQATDFNKDYNAYDRNDLYGSDMFSLANKIINYNKKEHESKDYTEITISIKIKSPIRGAQYFNKSNNEYSANDIKTAYDKLATKITDTGNIKYFGKAVSYWSKFGTSNRLDQQLAQEVESASETKIRQLKVDIQNYNELISEQKDMARKNFKCTKIEHDENTGRVIRMEFVER